MSISLYEQPVVAPCSSDEVVTPTGCQETVGVTFSPSDSAETRVLAGRGVIRDFRPGLLSKQREWACRPSRARHFAAFDARKTHFARRAISLSSPSTRNDKGVTPTGC